MNLFTALKNGVEAVLEGVVMKVEIKNFTDKKTQEKKQLVLATVGIPALMQNFTVRIPEKFVPDCVEGCEIHILPEIRVDNWNNPTLQMTVEKVF